MTGENVDSQPLFMVTYLNGEEPIKLWANGRAEGLGQGAYIFNLAGPLVKQMRALIRGIERSGLLDSPSISPDLRASVESMGRYLERS